MSAWPNPDKPGYPQNPERDGWHLWKPPHGNIQAREWRAAGYWMPGLTPESIARCGFEYHGPLHSTADLAAARAEGAEAMREACAGIAQGWLAQHGATNPEHISAQVWASDAVTDIIDGIRAIPAADALARRDAEMRREEAGAILKIVAEIATGIPHKQWADDAVVAEWVKAVNAISARAVGEER